MCTGFSTVLSFLIALELWFGMKADYWADPASIVTYAFAYVRTRLTGQSPSPNDIADSNSVRFRRKGRSRPS